MALRTLPGSVHIGVLADPAERITGHTVASARQGDTTIFVGRSATHNVVQRAKAGEFGLLLEDPVMLVVGGRSYAEVEAFKPRKKKSRGGRPAWVRWGVARVLILTDVPLRQPEVAAVLGTSQQAVSLARRQLGSLVTEIDGGLWAPDKEKLLDHWVTVYPGPGGQAFGWYGLDSARQQVEQAVGVAKCLGVRALVGGDVAADVLAPWKMPARGLVYVEEPVDLDGEGFVPVALSEASLVTIVPRDATIWATVGEEDSSGRLPVSDQVMVYADLVASAALDNAEAAEHLKRRIVGATE